jgi:hypothetical protein
MKPKCFFFQIVLWWLLLYTLSFNLPHKPQVDLTGTGLANEEAKFPQLIIILSEKTVC